MNQIRRTKRPKESPGERARTSILDAAEDLFAREGPSAVTLRSIAAAADVNVAAVNYYFGSKERLFEEMFLRRVVPLNEERLLRL
jgi:AcrR family transcriptional regulator